MPEVGYTNSGYGTMLLNIFVHDGEMLVRGTQQMSLFSSRTLKIKWFAANPEIP